MIRLCASPTEGCGREQVGGTAAACFHGRRAMCGRLPVPCPTYRISPSSSRERKYLDVRTWRSSARATARSVPRLCVCMCSFLLPTTPLGRELCRPCVSGCFGIALPYTHTRCQVAQSWEKALHAANLHSFKLYSCSNGKRNWIRGLRLKRTRPKISQNMSKIMRSVETLGEDVGSVSAMTHRQPRRASVQKISLAFRTSYHIRIG